MDACILELGPGSFHLLSAGVREDGTLTLVDAATERVALETNPDAQGGVFGRRATADAQRALARLLAIARQRGAAEPLVAVASPALGPASEVVDLLGSIRRRFGVTVNLLSPTDGARFVYSAVRREMPELDGSVAVACLSDATLDFAVGNGERAFTQSLSLGVARLHRAYGATESGLLPADAGALFALVRLSGGPMARTLRELGDHALVAVSENVDAVRRVAREWGYLEPGATSLDRLSLRALVTELLAATPAALYRLGIEPKRAALSGTTAVVLDALSDLLGQRHVHLSDASIRRGVAIETLADFGGGAIEPPRAPANEPHRISRSRYFGATLA
jgi:exopolyphosphatase/pppGpp-phosphohydrolase